MKFTLSETPVTLETLPQAFIEFANDVSEKFDQLLTKSNEPATAPDCWFDLNELCSYLPGE